MEQRTKVFLVFFLFFLAIYSAVAFYANASKPSQAFIGFGIFSGQDNLSGYTGPGGTINVNQTYQWTFNITNEMGTTQLIQIITRLGNNEMIGPNATSPATLQVLANSTFFVPNRSSTLHSFNWEITAVTTSGGPTELDRLTLEINGKSQSALLANPHGNPFRFYFELWTFNTLQSKFQYYTWLQIGFRVNS